MPQVTLQQALDLAAQLQKGGKPADAEAIYRQILAQQPNHAPSIENLAHLAYLKGDMAAAEGLLRRAISLNPGNAPLYANLGMLMAMSGRLEDAVAAFRQGIAIRPDFAEAHNNLGNALRELGRFEEATAEYNIALSLNPTFPEARWNMGLMLLMHGDFERGWPLYESRRDIANFNFRANLRDRQWDGSDILNRTILLQSEQGFGDTIQFIRYAPLLAERGARVVLQTGPELRRLLSGQCRIDQIVSPGEPLPGFDLSAPLLTLPRLFGTTLATIPHDVPYIRPDPSLIESWRQRLSTVPAGLKVGLSWAGRPTHPGDRIRSIPAQTLSALAEIPNVRFFSLQKWKPAAGDAPSIEMIDWTADLNDFADTAALLANLDVVISADTAVAHLAGAMGRKTWIMLPFVPDWRWLLNRTDSPWYPSMRLFRQPTRGDWQSVISNVCDALRSESRHVPA